MSLPEQTIPEPELPPPSVVRNAVDMELDALDAPEQAEGGGFTVNDRTQADWVGRLRQRRLDELSAIRHRAERQRAAVMAAVKPYLDPIDEWEQDRTEKLQREVVGLEALLTQYHRHEVETADVDPPLTIKLPHVELRSRKSPDHWTFDEAFVAWAHEHRPDLLREEVTKPAAKKAIRIMEGGTAVAEVAEADELLDVPVPGVSSEPGERSYWVVEK